MIGLLKRNKLETLVLLSTGIGLFISIEVGFLFGLSSDTDAYLTAIVLVNFLSLLSQLTWETINIDFIGENRITKNIQFSTHLFSTVAITTLICLVFFNFDSKILSFLGLKDVLPKTEIVIAFIALFCLFTYLKRVVFCEEDLFVFYLSELMYQVLVSIFIIVCFFLKVDITIANVVALTICTSYILAYAYIKYDIRLVRVSFRMLNQGFKGSAKLKVGSFFYSFKDILLPALFVRYGDGVYTLYNYISKIFTSLLSVLVLPQVNIFAIESLKKIKNNSRGVLVEAKAKSKKYTLKYAIVSFIVLTIFSLFIRSYIDVDFSFFVLMMISVFFFNVIICCEQFYARLVYNFKMYNYILFVNVIFGSTLYFIVKNSGLSVEYSLLLIVALQFVNFMLYYFKVQNFVEKN
jgi:O-antigen/teichoic acid export membrane protein